MSRQFGPRTAFDEMMLCIGESFAIIKELKCRELDARALTEEPSHEASTPLETGDVVVMLGTRMGGRFTDRDASRVWTVVSCDCDLCALGRHVAVDQLIDGGHRHIALGAASSEPAVQRRGRGVA